MGLDRALRDRFALSTCGLLVGFVVGLLVANAPFSSWSPLGRPAGQGIGYSSLYLGLFMGLFVACLWAWGVVGPTGTCWSSSSSSCGS